MEKTEQRRLSADTGGIAFGNHAAVMHHHDRLGSPERRFGRLLEGMVERGFQGGVSRFDDRRSRDLGKQRRRLRHLQRLDVVAQQIRLLRPQQLHAAETFVKGGAAAKQSQRRCVDGLGGAIDAESKNAAEPADAGAAGGF